jgi:hypothetical protein
LLPEHLAGGASTTPDSYLAMKHMDLRVLLIAIAAGDDVRRHSQYCTLLLPACLRNTATTASMAPTCTQKYILKEKLFRSFRHCGCPF